jgi:hypothetical protein
MIGHPANLPTKITGGNEQAEPETTTTLRAQLDTFPGNSGGPILSLNVGDSETTVLVEGITACGPLSITEMDESGKCFRWARCQTEQCGRSRLYRISQVSDLLDCLNEGGDAETCRKLEESTP